MKVKGNKNGKLTGNDENEPGISKEEKFLRKLRKRLFYGMPSNDDKGHSALVPAFRATPGLVAGIGRIYEKAPKDWFGSKSELLRCLLAGGIAMMEEVLDPDKTDSTIQRISKVLDGLNRIALEEKISSEEKRIIAWEQEKRTSPSLPIEQKNQARQIGEMYLNLLNELQDEADQ